MHYNQSYIASKINTSPTHQKKYASYLYGLKAEEMAAGYLQLQGYQILNIRYKTGLGDIDIICSKNDVIAFVEVKASKKYVVEELPYQKKRKNSMVALQFLAENSQYGDFNIRFDFLAIKNGDVIAHIKNAWELEALEYSWGV